MHNKSSNDNNPVPDPFDPNDPNEAFICPIRNTLMKDPVVAEDGRTYEREAIEEWFSKRNTSPMSNDVIGKTLRSNLDLKAAIVEHKKLYKQYDTVVKEKSTLGTQMTKVKLTFEEEMRLYMKKQQEKEKRNEREKEQMKQEMAAIKEKLVENEEHLNRVETNLDNFKASIRGTNKRAKELMIYNQEHQDSLPGPAFLTGITGIVFIGAPAAYMAGYVGLGAAVGSAGAATGLLATPVVIFGTFTAPFWGTVLMGGLCFTALFGAAYYAMDRFGTTPQQRDAEKIMKFFNQGSSVNSMGKELGFKLSGVLHCINYVLTELGSCMREWLCIWSKDTGLSDADKVKIISDIMHQVAQDTLEGKPTWNNNYNRPEVTPVTSRLKHIKETGYMPTSDKVRGQTHIDDKVINEGNALIDDGDGDKVQAQKSLLVKISGSAVKATHDAVKSGTYQLDLNPVITDAIALDKGWVARESKIGKAPNQGHAKQD